MRSPQIAIDHPIHTPLLLPKVFCKQIHQLVDPIATDKDTADDIDDPDQEPEERRAMLGDHETQRFDIVPEEDAWDLVVRDLAAHLGDGILIGEEAPPIRLAVILGGHNREEVLKLVKVLIRGSRHIVERVDQLGIQLPEAELINHMREVERIVIDMSTRGLIPMSLHGDVKVPADTVDIHTAVDPAAPTILLRVPCRGPSLALSELGPLRVRHHGVHMLLAIPDGHQPVGARVVEGGTLLGQDLAGEDPVHRGVLHVDVQGVARHRHGYVEVDLHAVADLVLDPEGLRLRPVEVLQQLVPGEVDA